MTRNGSRKGSLLIALALQLTLLATAKSPRPVPDDCGCDRSDYDIVCSNNSFTYRSPCQLNCESQKRVAGGHSPIRVDYEGECDQEGCICTADVKPVCGTDSNTYENQCWLSCYSDKAVRLGFDPIVINNQGRRSKKCNCPIDIIPSCGSDGVTYSSSCLIDCENEKRVLLGLPLITRQPGACSDSNVLAKKK